MPVILERFELATRDTANTLDPNSSEKRLNNSSVAEPETTKQVYVHGTWPVTPSDKELSVDAAFPRNIHLFHWFQQINFIYKSRR